MNVTVNKNSCNFGAGYHHDANFVCDPGTIFNPETRLCTPLQDVPSKYLSWTNYAVYISDLNPESIVHPGQHVSINGQKNCSQVGWTFNI